MSASPTTSNETTIWTTILTEIDQHQSLVLIACLCVVVILIGSVFLWKVCRARRFMSTLQQDLGPTPGTSATVADAYDEIKKENVYIIGTDSDDDDDEQRPGHDKEKYTTYELHR